jgi:hypothetical protein
MLKCINLVDSLIYHFHFIDGLSRVPPIKIISLVVEGAVIIYYMLVISSNNLLSGVVFIFPITIMLVFSERGFF